MKDVIYWKWMGKLLVVYEDENQVPYMYRYDDGQVYVGNDQKIRCLKCTGEVNFLWKTDTAGTVHCKHCGEDRGRCKNMTQGVRVRVV